MSEVLRGEWELAGWKSRSKAFQTKVTAPEEASCMRVFLQSGALHELWRSAIFSGKYFQIRQPMGSFKGRVGGRRRQTLLSGLGVAPGTPPWSIKPQWT